MRVIAGRYKGRRLRSPSWTGLRPTSDRLRATLFDVLGARVEGARVIDACAGTGALGIEALSRGAAHVTFVERDRRAVGLIERNLAACGITRGYTMMAAAVERVRGGVLERAAGLVLVDPPYEIEDLVELLDRVARWLAPGGTLVLEHGTRRQIPEAVGGLRRVRQVRAGDSCLSLYEAADEP